jgi:hypothetical protein
MANNVDVIEIEEYAKSGKPIPAGQHYKIRVDKEKIDVEVESLTGEQILGLKGVDKKASEYKLFQHSKGKQPIEVKAADVVTFTAPGIERFSTLARDSHEG